MTDLGRRRSLPQVLTGLATLAVLLHLYGLYRSTGPPVPRWFPQADKLEHLVGFAAPVWLILLARGAALSATTGRPTPPPRRFVLVVVGVFALHGVVSELAQHFFYVHRTGDAFDTLADWAGVASGLALARLSERRRRLRKPDLGGVGEVQVRR